MTRALFCAAAIIALAAPALAIDHDNVDGGRPLRFDDAEAIAFRERAVEFGLAAYSPFRRRGLGAVFSTEYLYGFAVNSHFSLDVDSSVGARSGTNDKRFDLGNIGIGVFHNFNRETLKTPTYAARADVYLPTGRGSRGAGLRLRGVMSRTFAQYNRVHVNIDAHVQTAARSGDRSFIPAVTVGFTRPLGYPTYFNRTGLAEIGVRASEESGRGAIFYGGVGIRQQVTVRSALDVGVRSDFAATNSGAARDNVTLVGGYSTQF